MLSKQELEKPRTPAELCQYFWHVYDNATPEEKTKGRVKEGLYKNFYEELNVLNVYCNWKFPDNDVTVKYIIGNQGYDAIIKGNSYEEYVEITFPVIGEKDKEEAKRINRVGYSPIGRSFSEIIERFTKTAECKALKNYIYTNSSLLFAIDIFTLPCYKSGDNKAIIPFIDILQKYSFKAKSVYIILLNEKHIEYKVIFVSKQ